MDGWACVVLTGGVVGVFILWGVCRYLSIDDLRYIVTTDGNPLSGQDLEEFLAEADIFKNGVVDYKAFAEMLLSEQ